MTILQSFLAGSSFNVDSADFDAANDYMTAALTGASDSKTGVLSAWLRIDGSDSTLMDILFGRTLPGDARFRFLRGGTNRLGLLCTNSSNTTILDIYAADVTSGAAWRHFLASWDLTDTGKRHIYLDDVSDLNVVTYTNDTLDYTNDDWGVGAVPNGSNKFDGCLAEFYFAPGEYLDFSVESNRRKFITASLRPVYLGTDGSVPTGTAPIVYLHLGAAEAVANFATNRGTGGNFSITGTLTTGSTSPSD